TVRSASFRPPSSTTTNVCVRLCASTPRMIMKAPFPSAESVSVRDRAARRTGLYRGSSARLLSNHAERSGVPGGRPFGNKPQPELGTEIMSQPARPVHHDIQPEIITHAVWLYHRFALSHRDVGELLAERWHPGQLRGH